VAYIATCVVSGVSACFYLGEIVENLQVSTINHDTQSPLAPPRVGYKAQLATH
jgi:hypothetical protein